MLRRAPATPSSPRRCLRPVWLAAALAGLVSSALGCPPASPPAPTSAAGLHRPPVVLPPATAAPTASATAVASAEASAPAPEPPAPKRPTEPTPGRIECYEGPCSAGTQACWGVNGCTPIEPTELDACVKHGLGATLFCDDAPDCPAGQQCCAGSEGCAACSSTPCLGFERCLVSETCRAGYQCIEERCRPILAPSEGVPCGDVTCAGETPICCWRDGEGWCEGSPPPDHWPCGDNPLEGATLRCTSDDHCAPGQRCCGRSNGSSCFEGPQTCAGSGGMGRNRPFCRTLRDCPPMPLGKKANECAETSSFPPGVKACFYPL